MDTVQRYYAYNFGRFNTPDRMAGSANPTNPASWNRYAYVNGDPINGFDPTGLVGRPAGSSPNLLGACGSDPPGSDDGGDGDDGYGEAREHNQICAAPGPDQGGGGSGVQSEWAALSPSCQQALQTAIPKTGVAGLVAALNRANAAEGALLTAVAGTSISWDFLAAIGLRETGFQNLTEVDGAGGGVGVFQLTVSPTSGVTAAQAGNFIFSAGYAANLLNSDMSTLAAEYPNLTMAQLWQATAASYNFGTRSISGNPTTIDVGTTGGNYGSNVMQLMTCFPVSNGIQ